jgi:molecular chaperone DnaK (HSP70)
MSEIGKVIGFDIPQLTTPIRALGIDRGTTNSSAAAVEGQPGGEPACRVLEIDRPMRETVRAGHLVIQESTDKRRAGWPRRG